MTREAAIKWQNEIKAFQEGKTIQRQTRGVWFDEKSPRFEVDVEYRVKPEAKKRTPTIEEVEKWFLENKVFRYKGTDHLYRITQIAKKLSNPICIQCWISIDSFCHEFTNYDGSELYINEN